MREGAEIFGIDLKSLISQSRFRHHSHARQGMWLALSQRGMSSCEIGRRFNRDHSTVLHGLKSAKERASREPIYAEKVRTMSMLGREERFVRTPFVAQDALRFVSGLAKVAPKDVLEVPNKLEHHRVFCVVVRVLRKRGLSYSKIGDMLKRDRQTIYRARVAYLEKFASDETAQFLLERAEKEFLS